MVELSWLPRVEGWGDALRRVAGLPPAEQWAELQRLANSHIDFIETAKLDRAAHRIFSGRERPAAHGGPIRLALLGSSTLEPSCAGDPGGRLRRGLWIEVFEGEYGQYRHELMDSASALHAFLPMWCCWRWTAITWRRAASAEAAIDDHAGVLGDGAGDGCDGAAADGAAGVSAAARQQRTSAARIRPRAAVRAAECGAAQEADAEGVDLLAVDAVCGGGRHAAWHDPALWHRAKQEVHPAAAPIYGDLVGAPAGGAAGAVVQSAWCSISTTRCGAA